MKFTFYWPKPDEKILAEAYKLGGLKAACMALPDFKRGTIATKASRMKLTKPRPRKNK